MDKLLVSNAERLIESNGSILDEECDIFEKSAIFALALQKLVGGEIRAFGSDVYKPLYYNKVNGEYVNLINDEFTMCQEFSKKVQRNELLGDNFIAYNYYKFIIKIMYDYMEKYCEQNRPVVDFTDLGKSISLFERFNKQSIASLDCDKNYYSDIIKDIRMVMADMQKKYKNIRFYLHLEKELNKSLNDYKEFKNRVLSKKR